MREIGAGVLLAIYAADVFLGARLLWYAFHRTRGK
jgi:hypothetical protein